MNMSIVLILLLALLGTLSSHGELKTVKKNEREFSERVLIRTKRRWVLSTVDLEEEQTGPFPRVLTKLFNDKQLSHAIRFHISGHGVTEDPKDVFTIDENTGEVYIHKAVDRELYPSFVVNFNVMDQRTGEMLDRALAFSVAIKDKNDNPPVFTHKVYQAQIPENIKEGLLPLSLLATDRDENGNNNSRISMTLLSQDPAWPKLTLKPSPTTIYSSVFSQLVFTGCFDYDKVKMYKLLVEAKDHGIPSLSSTTTVSIAVTDSNTHVPVFTASKYNAQVLEMETTEILRVAVRDLDTPNTPASKAVYTILKGNKDENFNITTDLATNEGVLRVIKGFNYEKSNLHELQIGVENEEPLFSCVDGKASFSPQETVRQNSAVTVTVEILNKNDPPVFEKNIMTVFRVEEGEPGDVLYQPNVIDEDSDVANIRYELVEDRANWMSIDPKTGKITTVKKMDRESQFVHNGTYTVVMRAIDDGKPPGTGTGTLVIVLGDKNDNTPRLTSNSLVMCVNKVERVMVKAQDDDGSPYGEPFTFMLGDEELKSQWKLEPPTGSETLLISLKSLPYGNYSIPVKITDQQGALTQTVMQVMVCDCEKRDVCRHLLPRSSNLSLAAMGVILGSLLMLALLLCIIFLCECQEKKSFQVNLQDEGIQTLIKYNEEGIPKEQNDLMMLENTIGNYQKTDPLQYKPQMNESAYRTSAISHTQAAINYGNTANMMQTYSKYKTWSPNRMNTQKSSKPAYSRSISFQSEWNLQEYITRKLSQIPEQMFDAPRYQPQDYSCEGTISRCPSLDKLSLSSTKDLQFLEDLDPKFLTLAGISQQAMETNMKL